MTIKKERSLKLGILEKSFSVQMHYRNSKVQVSLMFEGDYEVHTAKFKTCSLYDAFVTYKAYERFVEEHGHLLALDHLTRLYNVDCIDLSFSEAVKAVGIAQQKELEEKELCEM